MDDKVQAGHSINKRKDVQSVDDLKVVTRTTKCTHEQSIDKMEGSLNVGNLKVATRTTKCTQDTRSTKWSVGRTSTTLRRSLSCPNAPRTLGRQGGGYAERQQPEYGHSDETCRFRSPELDVSLGHSLERRRLQTGQSGGKLRGGHPVDKLRDACTLRMDKVE